MNELARNVIRDLTFGTKRSQREAIMDLESHSKEQPQLDVDVDQLIHAGMYVRAAHVKAGTLLTGAIYKYDHIEIMAKGSIIVTTDDGTAVKLDGFNIQSASSGKKRAAYVIEDTTWTTIHFVGDAGGKDGDEIQNYLTTESFEELNEFYATVNRFDYNCFLNESGYSKEQVRKISEETSDYDDSLELEKFGLSLKESLIEGTGLFTTKELLEGDFIMPARIGEFRTQAGKYINHALRPNAKFIFDGENWVTVALDEIAAGDEITVNYRNVILERRAMGDICQA